MSSFRSYLAALMAQEGSLSVERVLCEALYHPEHGYYATQNPIGGSGDYITAPEMTQVFGEIIGLWVLEAWELLGKPPQVALVEVGPGRGTMMRDMARLFQRVPDFAKGVSLHLIEQSAFFREIQKQTLGKEPATSALSCQWYPSVEEFVAQQKERVPHIILANEFFDALPLQQFVFQQGQWRERRVGLSQTGHFQWEIGVPISDATIPLPSANESQEDGIFEWNEKAQSLFASLTRILQETGGALWVCDYGYAETKGGESLQALQQHRYQDILSTLGKADLSSHVNFAPFLQHLRQMPFQHISLETLSEFLIARGLEMRTYQLVSNASPSQRRDLILAAARLSSPQHMGTLFKVLTAFIRKQVPPLVIPVNVT